MREEPMGGLQLLLKAFRRERHRVSQSERTTVHGADSMLMLLQLAMAEVNKQHGGKFKVALSDVLMAWKHLLLDKLHLPTPSCTRLENYDLILGAYESFLKRSNTVDLVDVLSMCKQLKALEPAELVSPIQLREFLSGNGEIPEFPSTPSSKSRPRSSQVKAAVRRVFCSYLSLLVNSKNDLALALTLDIPVRNLGREAFTDIKHAARDGNTSLFLALTSFVRAIQLGGKGYAPAESDPLRKHMKGLLDYVQFMDNLEEILGEIADPSACGAKLVMAIRAALVKGRGSTDLVFAAAEETAKELRERIFQLHLIQKQLSDGSGSGISPARPKAYAVNHATAYGGRDTLKVLMALLDDEALAPPWPNKADVLCEEQVVLSGEEGASVVTLFRSPEVSAGCSPEPLRNRVQSRLDLPRPKAKIPVVRSQFACTYRDELPLSRVLDFPSSSQVPSCKHPAAKLDIAVSEDEPPRSESEVDPGNPTARGGITVQSGNAQHKTTSSSRRKKTTTRVQTKREESDANPPEGCENEPPKKRQQVSVNPPVRNNAKSSNKKKLLTGQGKITSFFRV